ncbi:MAG TPA: histidine kinase, partial [Bryobacteraceae bacterium]|nr:histidine kinase [Bryobacteraceae bacterium]
MAQPPRGKLKIFIGYAAGVGKTYQMLEEAQELKAQGVDVVVGYFEPHGRADTIAKTQGLETIPRKMIEYR